MMSEELYQRKLISNPPTIDGLKFYSIGSTSINALIENQIIRPIDYGDIKNCKPDGVITNSNKDVIAIIENKDPKVFRTTKQQQNAGKQARNVASKIGAKICIATDGNKTIWINALTGNRIKNHAGIEIDQQFDRNENTAKLLQEIYDSITDENDSLTLPHVTDPSNLAHAIWQDIWTVSGATPENCLYTFVELFIFKYLSDLQVLKGDKNFYDLMNSYKDNTENDVLEKYATLIRPKIKELFPPNPNDKTTIINGTIFVSKDEKAVTGYSTVFHKVLKKFQDEGKLEHIDHEFKSKLFESFLKESISKKNWGQFFTPLKVVRSIVDMAEPQIKEERGGGTHNMRSCLWCREIPFRTISRSFGSIL